MLIAGNKRELAQTLGVQHKDPSVPLRATYIVDPEGVLRHVSVNDLSVGCSVDETIHILARPTNSALATGRKTRRRCRYKCRGRWPVVSIRRTPKVTNTFN